MQANQNIQAKNAQFKHEGLIDAAARLAIEAE